MTKPNITETHASIVNQWHPENEKSPESYTYGSTKKVMWLCEKGHKWSARIDSRTMSGAGCPQCCGKEPVIGRNDLKTLYPSLAKEWGDNPKGPEQYLPKSNKKVNWVCKDCDYSWTASIHHRVGSKSGCPLCVGAVVVAGVNDLKTLRPDLSKQWSRKNTKKPKEVSLGSTYRAWWICNKGHEWDSFVYNRVRGTGCPYCSGLRLNPGVNDLATTDPDVSKEFHPGLNTDRPKPTELTRTSTQLIWWLCSKGHAWETSVRYRVEGSGCHECRDNLNTEKLLVEYLSEILDPADSFRVESLKWSNNRNYVVDFLSKDRVVVEYDGGWHAFNGCSDRDIQKTQKLLEAGYKVIRLRQKPLELLDIKHENLIQVSVKWDKSASDIKEVLSKLRLK